MNTDNPKHSADNSKPDMLGSRTGISVANPVIAQARASGKPEAKRARTGFQRNGDAVMPTPISIQLIDTINADVFSASIQATMNVM